jgi:uncharacterized metal-binding protein
MTQKASPNCAKCTMGICEAKVKVNEEPPINKAPGYCPMKNNFQIMEKARLEYEKPEVKEFARQASIQEFECYEVLPEGIRTKNPRILELIQFAQKCRYKKLGLAFCAGLAGEARMLADILENNGFEVVSVRCKAGAIPKEKIGIKPEEKISGPESYESMCNPVAQAELLNNENVDLAVMLGLCIGHDTLFFKYCRVPVTVIAVKDRVTGHNPLAALYLSDSYYRRIKNSGTPK